jgi:hypothetical protein
MKNYELRMNINKTLSHSPLWGVRGALKTTSKMKKCNLTNAASKLTLLACAAIMMLSVYSCKMIAEMTPESLEGTTWSGKVKYKEKVNGAVVSETDCVITFHFENQTVSGNIKKEPEGVFIKKVSDGIYNYVKPNVSLTLDWGDGDKTTKAMIIANTILWTDEYGTIYSLAKQ